MTRLPHRFWDKVDFSDAGGCWLWTGCQNGTGYGLYSVRGRSRYAHRVSYTTLVEDIPEGLVLDHLCRVRHCVRPEHLEPVTHAENQHRSTLTTAAINKAKTTCPRGHPYDTITGNGERRCRACFNRQNRESYHRLKNRTTSMELK